MSWNPERWTPELQSNHRALSEVDLHFRELARRDAAWLDRETFAVLDRFNPLLKYRLQSWPTFIDRREIDHFAEISLRMNLLIRSIPERLFGGDPRAIAEFYGLESGFAELILTPPNTLESLISRGDFIRTADGFRCIEFNMTSNLGGWETSILAEMLYGIEPVRRFIEELPLEIEIAYRNTLRLLFEHVLRVARGEPLRAGGEINSAIGMRELDQVVEDATLNEFLEREYAKALERVEAGLEGRIVPCNYPSLELVGSALHRRGVRIHNLIEQHIDSTESIAFMAQKAGELNLFNGPISIILGDKRNLALLSENAEDERRFDAGERALLAELLPWTRRVRETETGYRGQTVVLPDFLLAEQPRMVLKKARSQGGEGVVLGRGVGREEWAARVAAAVEGGDWVVQEKVDSISYLYQAGEHGCYPHDVIWGPFIFGSTYAGTILRMQAKELGGIVNLTQGATEGMIFEISEEDE